MNVFHHDETDQTRRYFEIVGADFIDFPSAKDWTASLVVWRQGKRQKIGTVNVSNMLWLKALKGVAEWNNYC